MKANITRYVDAALRAAPGAVADCIDIRLNGFVCHIAYCIKEPDTRDPWLPAIASRRVLGWSVNRRRHSLSGVPVDQAGRLETLLAPLLGRVLDGHSLAWNGREHEGRLTPDAEAAFAQIDAHLHGPVEAWPGTVDDAATRSNVLVIDDDWRARLRRQTTAGPPPAAQEQLVSIIVGVHNKAAFVIECLTSVLTQEGVNVEIVCIDDASSDNSAILVENFAAGEPRIRFIRNTRNAGAGPTRNRALALARGKYVMFLDADDLLAPGSLRRLLEVMERDGADMARGGIAFYYPGKDIALRPADIPPDRNGYGFAAEPHLWIPWWFTTFMYSRSFLDAHGLTFPPLADGEDPVFLAAALTRAKVISSLSEVVYYYRKHRGQKRNDGDYLAHLEAVGRIFSSHDPRTWRDGYAQHVAAHDIPARLARRPAMAEDPRYHALMATIVTNGNRG